MTCLRLPEDNRRTGCSISPPIIHVFFHRLSRIKGPRTDRGLNVWWNWGIKKPRDFDKQLYLRLCLSVRELSVTRETGLYFHSGDGSNGALSFVIKGILHQV